VDFTEGFVPTLLDGFAPGVLVVPSGDGVVLLKKLFSGEVLPLLICPLAVGAADVAAIPTAVVVVFWRAELAAAWGVLMLTERPVATGVAVAGFAMAELACGTPGPAPSFAERLAKKLLEEAPIPGPMLGLRLEEIGLLVTLDGWVGLAGAATTGVGALLTLGDWLGLGEAGRLAAGWLVLLPLLALLLFLCARAGLTNNIKTKATAIPTSENFAFSFLYLPVNMAGLLNYVQPFIP